MTSWALLFFGIVGALATLLAWRSPRAPGGVAIALFFVAWPTAELAMHHAIAQAAIGTALVAVGALARAPGWIGLALVVASVATLVVIHLRGARARDAFARALDEALGGDAIEGPARAWIDARLGAWALVAPFLARPRGVVVRRRVPFWQKDGVTLHLDVHAPRVRPSRAPALVYVHGGGWVLGYRRFQGLPLMRHLASLGWVCFSIDYRLSPRATFPDHLDDVKRAIAWVRAHADEYGADPDFLVLAGNSAGAHLAALAALSPETRVAGCLGFYGVYDFEDRHGHWPHRSFARFVERVVLKARRDERPELFARASPIAQVGAHAPPFLLVHGDRDTLAPPDESRRFAEALRAASPSPVVHVEIEGAQHAFEIFPSPRAAHAVHGATRFLAWLYSETLNRSASHEAAE